MSFGCSLFFFRTCHIYTIQLRCLYEFGREGLKVRMLLCFYQLGIYLKHRKGCVSRISKNQYSKCKWSHMKAHLFSSLLYLLIYLCCTTGPRYGGGSSRNSTRRWNGYKTAGVCKRFQITARMSVLKSLACCFMSDLRNDEERKAAFAD